MRFDPDEEVPIFIYALNNHDFVPFVLMKQFFLLTMIVNTHFLLFNTINLFILLCKTSH